MGNHAVSYGALLSRVKVISAYPITPQTQVVEMLSEMCADGRLNARFINVESEHSAMAAVIGASSAGVRAFTATSSQGLALMHELLHWAAIGRLPIVLANINRALASGWNIWSDQSDSLAQRDTGWIQFYCESNQEVIDTTIIAFRVAERLLVPTMLSFDAFYLSHTYEPVDIPDQAEVDAFLPTVERKYKLDVDDPRSFGGIVFPDHYMEIRYVQETAMDQAAQVIEEVEAEFAERFGRSYGLVEEYRTEGADIIFVGASTLVSTAREMIDTFREEGHKVGLLKMRVIRPYPVEHVRRALANAKKVVVIDRNISPGMGGIFAQELKAAFAGASYPAPPIFPIIAGLGGRDINPKTFRQVLEIVTKAERPNSDKIWMDVRT